MTAEPQPLKRFAVLGWPLVAEIHCAGVPVKKNGKLKPGKCDRLMALAYATPDSGDNVLVLTAANTSGTKVNDRGRMDALVPRSFDGASDIVYCPRLGPVVSDENWPESLAHVPVHDRRKANPHNLRRVPNDQYNQEIAAIVGGGNGLPFDLLRDPYEKWERWKSVQEVRWSPAAGPVVPIDYSRRHRPVS